MIVRQLTSASKWLLVGNKASKSVCMYRFYSTISPQINTTTKVPHLTLYTGTDCQLCDVAKNVLDSISKDEFPFTLDLYNIRDDTLPEINKWRRAYQYDIPVLHLNRKEIARHRLQKDAIIDHIKTAQRSPEK